MKGRLGSNERMQHAKYISKKEEKRRERKSIKMFVDDSHYWRSNLEALYRWLIFNRASYVTMYDKGTIVRRKVYRPRRIRDDRVDRKRNMVLNGYHR